MNEEKKKMPLLPYEQVVKMIDERITEEEEMKVDERIVRVERAAEELEATRKEEGWGRKKRQCRLKRFWRKMLRCCKTKFLQFK